MKDFDESDYIKHKVLAVNIVNGFFAAHEKLSKRCMKQVEEICALENTFSKEEDPRKLNILSKEISRLSHDVLTLLAVKDRVDVIISRNRTRIEFFNKKLEAAGIYNEKYSKSELAELEKEGMANISEFSLNLNDSYGDGKKLCYFADELLLFNGDEINFSEKENFDILANSSSNLIHQIVFKYPSSVQTVTGDLLINTRFKQNLMKEVVAFVSENVKNHSIKDINSMLGGVLSFKTQMPQDTESYVAGISNLFNVMAKNTMLEKFPENKKEIESKLRCNDKSELIPHSKRAAVLGSGIAGQTLDDSEWESEEVRKSREKENQVQVAIDENLAKIYDDTLEDESKNDNDVNKKKEKTAQELEEEKMNQELEEMLFSMYRDDDVEG